MNRLIAIITFLFFFTQISFAQQPTPTPNKKDTDVVKISTNLIQMDVTVKDEKGNLVTDLKPKDFEVYENGVKQKITDVSFITSQKEFEINVIEGEEKYEIEPPSPTKEIKPIEVRRTIALIVDDTSLAFENVHFTKRALRKFVEKEMQKGDIVAIIRASAGLGALQQFTSNKKYLYQAIDQIKWKKSKGLGRISAFKPFSVASGDLDPQNGENDILTSEGGIDNLRNDVFAGGTLGAVNFVIEGMSKMPGRKSVMLFSDGFQIFTRGNNGLTESTRVLDKLKRLIDTANQLSVSVYTMDTRGLQTLEFTAADDLGSRPIRNRSDNPDAPFQTTAVTQDKVERLGLDRRNEFRDAQDGLNYLAKKTGGKFIRNTNDLFGGIRKMLRDQSYYLVAYETNAENFDPRQNKLESVEVKVKRENVKVLFRGMLSNPEDENNNADLLISANQKLKNALVSPFPINDINIKLSSLFQSTKKSQLFINSLLYIDVEDLKFSDAENNKKKASFDLLAANFDVNGIPTDQMNKTFTINVTNKIYKRMVREGFIFYFRLPIKKAGPYQMRVAIRDKSSDKIGSTNQLIGVPKVKNKKMVLSGMTVDSIPLKKWNAGLRGGTKKVVLSEGDEEEDLPVVTDTAVRRFKKGTVLVYGFDIYNAKRKKKKKSNLFFRTRVFRENKVVYEGEDRFIDVRRMSKKEVKKMTGAISLRPNVLAGNYYLQIIVTEQLAGKNKQIATQFVQFEIVE